MARETTPGNHGFIQGLLEHGIDTRTLHTSRTRKSERPTPECEAAVDEVHGMKSEPEKRAANGFTLISNSEEGHVQTDPELKSLIKEIKLRQHKSAEVQNEEGPEAA